MALELVQCHHRPDRPWTPSLPGTADPGLGACLLPSLHSALYSVLTFLWKRKIGSIRVPCRQSNILSLLSLLYWLLTIVLHPQTVSRKKAGH